MKQKSLLLIYTLLISIPFLAYSQDNQDFDDQREEQVKKWSKSGIGNVNEVLENVTEILAKDNPSINELKEGAKQANAAANYVGYLQEEYADYYRQNSRYEFVQKKVAPAHDAYVKKGNALKDARNKCYMRIGKILKSKGDITEAFFYFRDAYRLSTFDTRDEGIRYQAEQEMKELLGLEEIESYITW